MTGMEGMGGGGRGYYERRGSNEIIFHWIDDDPETAQITPGTTTSTGSFRIVDNERIILTHRGWDEVLVRNNNAW